MKTASPLQEGDGLRVPAPSPMEPGLQTHCFPLDEEVIAPVTTPPGLKDTLLPPPHTHPIGWGWGGKEET